MLRKVRCGNFDFLQEQTTLMYVHNDECSYSCYMTKGRIDKYIITYIHVREGASNTLQ